VALSWILSVRGLVDGAMIEVPFGGRRAVAAVSRPNRVDGAQFKLTIVDPPPDEAFMPVEPGGLIELGDEVGEIAFASLAVITLPQSAEPFAWPMVDTERADLLMEVRELFVVWWDGPVISGQGEWYSRLTRGPNLVVIEPRESVEDEAPFTEIEVVPLATVFDIGEADETVGYDACGNTSVDQVVIDASASEYTYPGEDAYAWCSLYGTTLTHLVCEEIVGALCSLCRVEVTTLNYEEGVFEEMNWYCDEILSNAVDTECEPEEFMGEDFPDEARQCVRGELYACREGRVRYLGDTGCPDCSEECD